jgi:hypothetical protein
METAKAAGANQQLPKALPKPSPTRRSALNSPQKIVRFKPLKNIFLSDFLNHYLTYVLRFSSD